MKHFLAKREIYRYSMCSEIMWSRKSWQSHRRLQRSVLCDNYVFFNIFQSFPSSILLSAHVDEVLP